MDASVAAASGAALAVIAGACVAAWRGSSRRKRFHVSDVGPALYVLFGANTIATAAKVGYVLALNRIKIQGQGSSSYQSVSSDEVFFLAAGVVAALIIGVVTIQDGYGDLLARNAD